jgi:hypothetical protein
MLRPSSSQLSRAPKLQSPSLPQCALLPRPCTSSLQQRRTVRRWLVRADPGKYTELLADQICSTDIPSLHTCAHTHTHTHTHTHIHTHAHTNTHIHTGISEPVSENEPSSPSAPIPPSSESPVVEASNVLEASDQLDSTEGEHAFDFARVMCVCMPWQLSYQDITCALPARIQSTSQVYFPYSQTLR